MNRHKISHLSGFSRPEHKAELLNDAGEFVGHLDTTWTSDILVWSQWRTGQPIARSPVWTEIIAQLHPLA